MIKELRKMEGKQNISITQKYFTSEGYNGVWFQLALDVFMHAQKEYKFAIGDSPSTQQKYLGPHPSSLAPGCPSSI